jgi:hypothetical protein
VMSAFSGRTLTCIFSCSSTALFLFSAVQI